MDDRFENLIRKRDCKLAWTLLGLFCVMAIAVSRLSYWVVGFASTNLMRHGSYLTIGILIAVACLMSVWATLGPGSLIRRTLFVACAAATILAAWMLGLMACCSTELDRLFSRDEFYALGLLPTIFFSLCLPLITLRWLFGFVLAEPHEEAAPKEPITTLSLMTVTALTGCCLAGVGMARQLSGANPAVGPSPGSAIVIEEPILFPLAIISGCSFLIGLLAVLPAVMFLCSRRRSYMVWSLVLNLIGSLLFVGVVSLIFRITGAWIALQDMFAIFEGSLAATATFSVGIGIIRLFGYRITRQAVRK